MSLLQLGIISPDDRGTKSCCTWHFATKRCGEHGRWGAGQSIWFYYLMMSHYNKRNVAFQQLCGKVILCSGFLSVNIIKSIEHSASTKPSLTRDIVIFLWQPYFSHCPMFRSHLGLFKSFKLSDFKKDSTYFTSCASANKWPWFPNTK